tara:strand:+ start:822 stop:1484 length:663 start_codon:yes stop_codon:yes gene_type:complete
MGILDNDTVIVDAILTKVGRQKLAQGQPLGITKFGFGDTGVDYTLYNPDHPSGSDSYGSAITSLPMLEAVPDDNVFMRSTLWGDGERNVSGFSFILVSSGTSVTIEKVPGETASNQIWISPQVYPWIENPNFTFKVLDVRGLKSATPPMSYSDSSFLITDLVPFEHPSPVMATWEAVGQDGSLELNAQDGKITSQKTVGVEITHEGAAPGFVTVTVQQNV